MNGSARPEKYHCLTENRRQVQLCCCVSFVKLYGVGRRKLDDDLFKNDEILKLDISDVNTENVPDNVLEKACYMPGCNFTAASILAFENHYNAAHRYVCAQCKKILPSPHLLDLHIQENHDSFFAVMAEKKPSYCCYVEECKVKFTNPDERLNHCVKEHMLPKNFRFDKKSKGHQKSSVATTSTNTETTMEVEEAAKEKIFTFNNSKQKTFAKYTGKKFTGNKPKSSKHVKTDVMETMDELKESLPQ